MTSFEFVSLEEMMEKEFSLLPPEEEDSLSWNNSWEKDEQ